MRSVSPLRTLSQVAGVCVKAVAIRLVACLCEWIFISAACRAVSCSASSRPGAASLCAPCTGCAVARGKLPRPRWPLPSRHDLKARLTRPRASS